MSSYKKDEEGGVGSFFQDKTVSSPVSPDPRHVPRRTCPTSARSARAAPSRN